MGLHKINAAEAVSIWPLKTRADSECAQTKGPWAIDVRSPSEFALDHLPFAHNWPVLDDAQRAHIGTLYKQVSPFEASKLGAAWVSENIARHLHQHVQHLDRNWRPLIYCWRGGQRSNSLAHVLSQVGFTVRLIEGGYTAFRQAMLNDLQHKVQGLMFVVIHGPTGCGKTQLLAQLHALGAQVLDLEALAAHRSSVLGQWPGHAQPSQKQFDTRLWDSLRAFDPKRVIYVEAESKRVGAITINAQVFERMQASRVITLDAPIPARVRLLCQDYAHFLTDLPLFASKLLALKPMVGSDTYEQWLKACEQGQWSNMVEDLLQRHYDPNYRKASDRLYPNAAHAPVIHLTSLTATELTDCAKHLLETYGV